MSKVILKGHIIVPAADFAAVKSELATHIALTKQEQGCLVFEAHQDTDSLYRFNFYEEFTNQESFSNHKNRVTESKSAEVTANIERHFQITKTK